MPCKCTICYYTLFPSYILGHYTYPNISSVTEETFHALDFTVGDGIEYPRFFERDELSDHKLWNHREHD